MAAWGSDWCLHSTAWLLGCGHLGVMVMGKLAWAGLHSLSTKRSGPEIVTLALLPLINSQAVVTNDACFSFNLYFLTKEYHTYLA